MFRIRRRSSPSGEQYVSLTIFASDVSHMLEYLKTDPDLVNCWHFAKLDSRTKALVEIGQNAVSLVQSYPATARERTALRGKLSESMILLFSSYFVLS